jgi:NADH-quinone oxidoreductase subunit J
MIEMFYCFAFFLIVFALGVVCGKNPVASLLCLVACFFNAGAIFLLNQAEFLAIILVVVYVGAVAVLFLFVVMTIEMPKQFPDYKLNFSKIFPIVITFLIICELAFLMYIKKPSKILIATAKNPIDLSIENTLAIGKILYTDYAYLFQISGIILFVAMVSAIVIAFESKKKYTKNNNQDNFKRNGKNSIVIISKKSYEGANIA